jgi:putative ABC transport system substrate-binding protein
MWNTTDPVGQGFVASLARPGGNITGLSDFGGELSSKRLQLVKEAIPTAAKVAIVFDPSHPAHSVEWRQTQAAARALGLVIQPAEVRAPHDIDIAFNNMIKDRVDAVIVFQGFIASDNAERIIGLAIRHRLPIMSGMKNYVQKGGLLYHTPDDLAMWRPVSGLSTDQGCQTR